MTQRSEILIGIVNVFPCYLAAVPGATHYRTAAICLIAASILNCTVACAQQVGADTQNTAFFETHVVSILEQRCYQCHSHASAKAKGGLVLDSRSGWQKGGSSGPAIVPGKPDDSLLIGAVRYDGFEMPPDEKLPDAEIALLEEWVAMGAPDPRTTEERQIDVEKLWALQPIERVVIPTPADPVWPQDAIDAFILEKLVAAGLRPAATADRYCLLRRVTFDLTGLPPTPDEIDSFLNDQSANAFEHVVDRLLSSTAFGDHWARHWFDLSCYADLADIQGNVLIRDAWRYRDYVIEAFNSDRPLDLFIHQQIAGDLLPYSSIAQRREQIIATGYLAIGPWTLQNYIKGQLDADVVDHQIDRIGRTFLGQTISCARCHDHKFDPVPTRDYYAMAGIFHNTVTTSYDGPGVWSRINHVALPKLEEPSQHRTRRLKLLGQLTDRRQEVQAELTSRVLSIPGVSSANVLTLQTAIAANENQQRYEINLEAGPSVWAAASQATSAADGLQIDILRDDDSVVAGFRHLPGAWSRTKDAQKMHPVAFTYTGDGTGVVRIRLTSSTPGSGRFGGAIDNLTLSTDGRMILQEDFNDMESGLPSGIQADTRLRVLAGAHLPAWHGDGINHSHAVELGTGNYAVQFFGGHLSSLAAARPAGEQGQQAQVEAVQLQQELQSLDSEISRLEERNEPEHAIAVSEVESPADSPIYVRGSFLTHGEIVPRGFLSAVPVSASYAVPPESSGRLQLAQWLTDRANPLTTRVLVNRIWHHLFGQGLVRSVDYFGVHGETPSHPELLDFLALRFREDDHWSLKQTVRHIVMSRTYQMASAHNFAAADVDPENRWLWKMPRRRLSAECIRDAMLSVSGDLNTARGGSPLGLELEGNIAGAGGNVNPANWGSRIPEYIINRRSIYMPYKRERPQGDLEILSTFDFPHPSEIVGARPQTTVATQALFLMNSEFVKRQARKLAERLAREEPRDELERIRRLYLLTLNRPVEVDEIEAAVAFLDGCTQDLTPKVGADSAGFAAWEQLCHAVLGSNSFLFRE